jgi:hypothetical protein
MMGIPIMMSDNLLLFRYFVDFYLDGFKIIRIHDISQIERGNKEGFFEDIIRKEGLYKKFNEVAITSIDNWKVAIQSINAKYPCYIIERELSTCGLVIGKSIKHLNQNLEFHPFSPTGEWEEFETIQYDEITCVSFNDGYSKTISKYVKQPDCFHQ